jgi:hypothetical protein
VWYNGYIERGEKAMAKVRSPPTAEQLNELQQKLGLTYSEALELWEYDNAIDKGSAGIILTKNQEQVANEMKRAKRKMCDAYHKDTEDYVVDLANTIAIAVGKMGATNITIPKNRRSVSFILNDISITTNIVRHNYGRPIKKT